MHALHLVQRPSHSRPQIYTCLMNESVLPHLLKHPKEMILIWHWNVRLFSTFFSLSGVMRKYIICIRVLIVGTTYLKEQLKKRVCFGSYFEGIAHHDRGGMAAGACGSWSHHVLRQEVERGEWGWWALSPLYSVQDPSSRDSAPEFRVDFHISVKSTSNFLADMHTDLSPRWI